jgi:hypothetical protein
LDKQEGESVQTNIDLQPKKSSSPKKRLTKNAEPISRITRNDWNPFERADPRVLEKVMRESTKQKNYEYEDALL